MARGTTWAVEGRQRQGDRRMQEDGRHWGGQVTVEDRRRMAERAITVQRADAEWVHRAAVGPALRADGQASA
jgi:hypothetical protein